MIKLPVGVFWLGSKSVFTNEIFIRPAYVEMLEAREAYREAGREFNVTLFTGTPGEVLCSMYHPSRSFLLRTDDVSTCMQFRGRQVPPVRAATRTGAD